MKTFFRLAKVETLYAIFSVFQAALRIKVLRLPALRVINWSIFQMVSMALERMGELNSVGELFPRMKEMGFVREVQGDTTIFTKPSWSGNLEIKIRKENIKGK